jgi:NAD(P)-dependent dehydrogenase (short-subunit alcohol dehydrogenase family)
VARGYEVCLADRSGSRAREAAEDLVAGGGRAIALQCDVADEGQVARMAEQALSELGHIDLLLLNAGIVIAGPMERIPPEAWSEVFEVNVLGTVRCLHALLPSMLKRQAGTVVITSSSQALDPRTPLTAPYVSSKFALVGLARVLALYLPPLGLRSVLFCPGLVDTAFPREPRTVGLTPEQEQALRPDLAAAQRPEEVAELLFDGIDEGRFLVTTTSGLRERMVAQAVDLDAYVKAQLADAAEGA